MYTQKWHRRSRRNIGVSLSSLALDDLHFIQFILYSYRVHVNARMLIIQYSQTFDDVNTFANCCEAQLPNLVAFSYCSLMSNWQCRPVKCLGKFSTVMEGGKFKVICHSSDSDMLSLMLAAGGKIKLTQVSTSLVFFCTKFYILYSQ